MLQVSHIGYSPFRAQQTQRRMNRANGRMFVDPFGRIGRDSRRTLAAGRMRNGVLSATRRVRQIPQSLSGLGATFTHGEDFACSFSSGLSGVCRPRTTEARAAFIDLQKAINEFAKSIGRPSLMIAVDGLIGPDTRGSAAVLGRMIVDRKLAGFSDSFRNFVASPSTLQLGIHARGFADIYIAATLEQPRTEGPKTPERTPPTTPPQTTPDSDGTEVVVATPTEKRGGFPPGLLAAGLGIAGVLLLTSEKKSKRRRRR